MAKRKMPEISRPVEMEEVIVNDTEVVEEIETSEEETYIAPEVYGIVTDCVRLNVRKEPKISSDIVCILDRNSKVSIDLDNSTDEWYKVCTETGFEGFCMKKFVSANI